MDDKEYEKRFDKWTDTLSTKQHKEFLELDIKRGELLSEAIKEAKKEVFDDIDNCTIEGIPLFHDYCNCEWCEIRKRHLSTFQKEKQHNYHKKKGSQ